MLVPEKHITGGKSHCECLFLCHNGLYCHQMLMWLSTFASLWCLKVATNQLCLLQFFASNGLQFEGKHRNSWESAIATPFFWLPNGIQLSLFKANSNLRKYLVLCIFQAKPCKQNLSTILKRLERKISTSPSAWGSKKSLNPSSDIPELKLHLSQRVSTTVVPAN